MPKKTEVVADLPEPGQKAEFLEIPFRDGVITIPRERGKWPTRALLALQSGDNLKAMETVLGAAQWDHLLDSEVDEFEAFVVTFADTVRQEVFKA